MKGAGFMKTMLETDADDGVKWLSQLSSYCCCCWKQRCTHDVTWPGRDSWRRPAD